MTTFSRSFLYKPKSMAACLAALLWPAILASTCETAAAQSSAPASATASPDKPLQFDVASVKAVDAQSSRPRINGGSRVYPGGRVVIQGLSLKALIQMAFNVSAWQISGGEDWTDKIIFDVEAKPPDDTQAPFKLGNTHFGLEDKRLQKMLQALLIDRFQLKFHKDTKTGVVSAIEKTDKQLRLTLTKTEAPVFRDNPDFCSIGRVAAYWLISDCTIQEIGDFASNYVLHHPVLDQTGLDGHFDFRYQILQSDPSVMPSDDSSFPDAIQAMGLKLQQSTGPVETLVIDHAEKPSGN